MHAQRFQNLITGLLKEEHHREISEILLLVARTTLDSKCVHAPAAILWGIWVCPFPLQPTKHNEDSHNLGFIYLSLLNSPYVSPSLLRKSPYGIPPHKARAYLHSILNNPIHGLGLLPTLHMTFWPEGPISLVWGTRRSSVEQRWQTNSFQADHSPKCASVGSQVFLRKF